jgi:broad specificity phosphatase PhoE
VSAGRLLHLVRHGETVGQSSIRYWGRTDVALSDAGRQQMRALGASVPAPSVAAVVHSPMLRAAESARLLVEALGLTGVPTRAEPDFAEIDFGAFEGLTRAEIAAHDPEWFAAYEARRHTCYPGGETLGGFAARVRAGLARTLGTGGDVLVVAHRGVIRHIADELLPGQGDAHTDLASWSTLRLGPTGVVRWNVRG